MAASTSMRADRLQRDLGGEIRRATQLQKCVVLAKRAVVGHVAAGLPHEPHRRAIDGFTPTCAQKSTVAHARRSHHACYIIEFVSTRAAAEPLRRRFSGGPVSPILVRPVREQFEHDRIIRVLQARYKRKFEVAINPGSRAERVGERQRRDRCFPICVLVQPGQERASCRRPIEVETTESINTLEAMAEWGPFSRLKVPFHLYVPPNAIDTARRLCTEHQIVAAEIWTYHTRSTRCASRWSIDRTSAPRRRNRRQGGWPSRPARSAEAGCRRQEAPAAKKPAPAKKPARAGQAGQGGEEAGTQGRQEGRSRARQGTEPPSPPSAGRSSPCRFCGSLAISAATRPPSAARRYARRSAARAVLVSQRARHSRRPPAAGRGRHSRHRGPLSRSRLRLAAV